jgi:hypothetical protein
MLELLGPADSPNRPKAFGQLQQHAAGESAGALRLGLRPLT